MCVHVCVLPASSCVYVHALVFANVINAYIFRPLKHFGLLQDGAALIMYHYYSVLMSVQFARDGCVLC